MLNPRRAKEFVIPSTLHGVSQARLFLFKMYQVLFQRKASVKAIAIGVSEVNPLGELTDCSTPLHFTRNLTLEIGL